MDSCRAHSIGTRRWAGGVLVAGVAGVAGAVGVGGGLGGDLALAAEPPSDLAVETAPGGRLVADFLLVNDRILGAKVRVGSTARYSYSAQNQSSVTITGTWVDRVYAQAGTGGSGQLRLVAAFVAHGPLAPHAFYSGFGTFIVPQLPLGDNALLIYLNNRPANSGYAQFEVIP